MGLMGWFDRVDKDRPGWDGGAFNTLNDFDHLQGDDTHKGMQQEEEWRSMPEGAASAMWHESQGGEHGEAMIWDRAMRANPDEGNEFGKKVGW